MGNILGDPFALATTSIGFVRFVSCPLPFLLLTGLVSIW